MTPEEHKKKHVALHKALDELFADYISHHPDQSGFTKMPIIDLITWSASQCDNPTESRE